MIDIARVRADTPSCEEEVHFNNAGASPMPTPVVDTMHRFLDREVRIGGYSAEMEARAALDDFYEAFATLLGCEREEVAFTDNATKAWDMAFYGIPFEAGDRILTCAAEFASNRVAFLHRANQLGLHIDVAADDESGQVDVADLERQISARTRLVAISHIPTHGGLVNPVEEIGRVTRKHGIIYLLDACQSVGQLPVDVRRIGCDFLSSTGRKYLRGPRGTGVLYANRSVLQEFNPPMIDAHAARWVGVDRYQLRDDARRFETYEGNVAGKAALARAARYTLEVGIENIWERVSSLGERLRRTLAEDALVELTDLGAVRCGIVTFRRKDEDPTDTWQRLEKASIRAWRTAKEWARYDFERRGIEQLVRMSVHYFNTEDEIDAACRVVSHRSTR